MSGCFRFQTLHLSSVFWKPFRTDLLSSKGRRGILCLSWEVAKILETGFDLAAQCGTNIRWPLLFLLQMYFLNFSGTVAAKDLPHLMCRWGPGFWRWVGLTYTEIHCLPFKWFSEDRHGSLPAKTLLSLVSTQCIWGAERRGLCCFQVLPEMQRYLPPPQVPGVHFL